MADMEIFYNDLISINLQKAALSCRLNEMSNKIDFSKNDDTFQKKWWRSDHKKISAIWREEEFKFPQNLPSNKSKKVPTWGEGGVKNYKKMPTSFRDGL